MMFEGQKGLISGKKNQLLVVILLSAWALQASVEASFVIVRHCILISKDSKPAVCDPLYTVCIAPGPGHLPSGFFLYLPFLTPVLRGCSVRYVCIIMRQRTLALHTRRYAGTRAGHAHCECH